MNFSIEKKIQFTKSFIGLKGVRILRNVKKSIFLLHFLKAAIEEEGELYGPGIDESMLVEK